MQFNSLVFIIFAILFFAGWPILRKRNNSRWIYLVGASFIFYGWWDWRFLFLIMFSGFIDYFAGIAMEKFPLKRRLWLILSLIGNVGSLAVFKYLDFGIANVNSIISLFGFDFQFPAANLILPVGISFYTFQSMSYTIDIYKGNLKPTYNVFHFFAYLALFPQLVAGPIVRAKDLLPQLKSAPPVGEGQRWEGLQLIAFGFFKKVVVADNLAAAVNAAFGAAKLSDNCAYWWLVIIMFGFQIYCDFSGYSDIARGLGKWMGYEFPVNFRNPYIASSFREFWERWHISLSTWFRDYVYIPLGGSRKGKVRSHINMWITMLISGLWHGAAWHFILWSAVHSFFLSAERLTNWPTRVKKLPGGRHIATILVFLLATLAWVFFRAQTFSQAIFVYKSMFTFTAFDLSAATDMVTNKPINVLIVIVVSQLLFYFGLDKSRWSVTESTFKKYFDPVVFAVILLICVFMRAESAIFIYFQF